MTMGRVFGLVFLAVGLFFTFAIQWAVRKQNDANQRYRPVTAHVVKARVNTNTSGSGSTRTRSYSPNITYAYTVAGKQYTSKRFQFFGKGHSNYESAAAVIDAYPVGGEITAYYDPQKPAEAVLDRTPCDTFIVNIGTVAFWSVIIGAVLYEVWRRRTRSVARLQKERQRFGARESVPVAG